MTNTKHEDALLKMGVEYFREHILRIMGINYTYEETAPTELVELKINELYMDFTFKTTLGLYIHVEFQTTDDWESEDLRRFHSYEAVFSHNTGKKVLTYVIYTGGIVHTKGELDCGAYTYRVIPVYMGQKDADEIIFRLRKKRENGEPFTEDDFAQLSLTPLMGGTISRKDKIKEGILLAKQENTQTSEKVTAMLYALADKFLEGKELEEIKEAVTMTRLGQMIMEDGKAQGITIGKAQGITIGKAQGITIGKRQGTEKGIEIGRKEMAQLFEKLLLANRENDCLKAATDEEYCEELLKEFRII